MSNDWIENRGFPSGVLPTGTSALRGLGKVLGESEE